MCEYQICPLGHPSENADAGIVGLLPMIAGWSHLMWVQLQIIGV